MALTWDDAEAIAAKLAEAHPGVDPLDLNFVTLHRWVCELPDFTDAPQASTEARLERIQMAWLEQG